MRRTECIYIYTYNTIATTLLPPHGVAAAAPAGKGRNTGRGRKFTGWADCALSRCVWVCVLAYSIYLCAALHINCYTYMYIYDARICKYNISIYVYIFMYICVQKGNNVGPSSSVCLCVRCFAVQNIAAAAASSEQRVVAARGTQTDRFGQTVYLPAAPTCPRNGVVRFTVACALYIQVYIYPVTNTQHSMRYINIYIMY